MTEQEKKTFDLVAAINATDNTGGKDIMLMVKKETKYTPFPSQIVESCVYQVSSDAQIKDEDGKSRIVRRYYEVDNAGIIQSAYHDNSIKIKNHLTITEAIIHGYYYIS